MSGPPLAAVTPVVDEDGTAATPSGVDVEDLFVRHTGGLLRYLSRRVRPATAEDLVSQVFEIVVAAPDRYDPDRGTPRAWLYGITTHVLLGHFRTSGRAQAATARLAAATTEVDDPSADVVARLDAARRVGRLATAIDALAADDREVLLLTAWTDLTATEIGDALGVAPGTVRSRLHRARRDLRAADLRTTDLQVTDRWGDPS